jgi:hypothetical protein
VKDVCTVKDADGRAIEIVAVEADDATPASLDIALRALARLMVRAHSQKADRVANEGQESGSSALTVPASLRTHQADDDAA